jgi:hypothetical protein
MTQKSQPPYPANEEEGSPWITKFLLPNLPAKSLEAVDRYRRNFEKEWGPTDLTRHYTSMLPIDQHNWLFNNAPKRYWDGLPKFYQGFMRGQAEAAAAEGSLDNWPDPLVKIYMQRQMTIKGERTR